MMKKRLALVLTGMLVLSSCIPTIPVTTSTKAVSPQRIENPAIPTSAFSKYYGTPPAAKIIVGDQEQGAGVGTSTWIAEQHGDTRTIKQADAFGIVAPVTALLATTPFTLTLVLPIPFPPSSLQYRLQSITDSQLPKAISRYAPIWDVEMPDEGIPLKKESRQAIPLFLEPGLYLCSVDAEWPNLGSVSYGFFLKAQSPPPLQTSEARLTAFDLSQDEQVMAVAGPAWVRIYDRQSFDLLASMSLPGAPTQIEFNPLGSVLALAFDGGSGMLWRWDAESYSPPIQFRVTDDDLDRGVGYMTLDWSPDGRLLVVGTDTTRLVVLDGKTGEMVKELWNSTNPVVTEYVDPAWSPDGQYIISNVQGKLAVWDPVSGEQVRAFHVQRGMAGGMIVCPLAGDTRLALGSMGDPLEVWNWDAGEPAGSPRLKPKATAIDARSWSPNGQYIAGALMLIGETDIWDVASGQIAAKLPAHAEVMRWSPDSTKLYILTGDSRVQIWNWRSGKKTFERWIR